MMKPKLHEAYSLLFERFGPQNWWPGETPFEVMVGAILTQNTNWGNVEKAICNLKSNSLLDPVKIRNLRHDRLASLIRPAGYYNIKAKRLKNFVNAFCEEFAADLKALKKLPASKARDWLLEINGVGEETADSILLYALEKPVFVIDAYTKRVLERHRLCPEDVTYGELQALFMDSLDPDTDYFNEYHALIVRVGKEFCRRKPRCEGCPLNGWNW